MKKYYSMIITSSIVVGVILLIATFYYTQESELNEAIMIEAPNFEQNLNNSDTGEITDIAKKLDDIEKKANDNSYTPAPREWITSGPFQVDRSKYLMGEKVFIKIGGLDVKEKGQIAFLKQTNDTHYTVFQTIPFDGAKKSLFNYYTDIKLSKVLGLCSVDDILGEWTVVFRGTDYADIKFEIINEILPGEEDSFTNSVC